MLYGNVVTSVHERASGNGMSPCRRILKVELKAEDTWGKGLRKARRRKRGLMGAWLLRIAIVMLLVAATAVACTSAPGQENPAGSSGAGSASVAASTSQAVSGDTSGALGSSATGGSFTGDSSSEPSFPTPRPSGTVLDPRDTTTTAPIPGLERYADAMRALKDDYVPRFAVDMSADYSYTDFLHRRVADPMNATQGEIAAWQAFGDLVDDYVADLARIEPPRELSSAHAGLVEGWQMIARYCDASLQAIRAQDRAALQAAEEIRQEAEIRMFANSDTWPVGNAIGFWPHPWGE